MHAFLLLGCFVLAVTQYYLGSAHMIPDDRLSTNRVVASNALSQSLQIDPPPVVIVGKYELQCLHLHFQNNLSQSGIYINLQTNVCCDVCAFCQCRLFKTVCFCRMGNPRC
uniref:Agouti domain-containing protein n=1 Tax=Fundulus heteroclitus TaxID=8078 RepID=A0A3Q2PSZ1_FUNHE